jgi:hypothetical protein
MSKKHSESSYPAVSAGPFITGRFDAAEWHRICGCVVGGIRIICWRGEVYPEKE